MELKTMEAEAMQEEDDPCLDPIELREIFCEEMEGPIAPFKQKSASRTSEKARCALRFDEFASIQGCPKLNEFTLDDIGSLDSDGNYRIMHIFCSYATFVLDMKQTVDGKSVPYSPASYLKFFSTPKTILANRFQKAEWMQKDHPKNRWWATLYADFKFRSRAACIKNGGKLEETTEGIHYKELEQIVIGLLNGIHKSTGKASADDIEVWAAIAMLRQAAGRSSEAALVSFTGMSWQNGRLHVDWEEIKNAKSTLLDFYPDARGFLLDPYHAIGCMVLTKPGCHASQPMDGE